MTEVKSRGASMKMKIGMQVAQGYTIFNYRPQRLHKDLRYQDRKMVTGIGVKLAPFFFSQGISKRKLGNNPPQMR